MKGEKNKQKNLKIKIKKQTDGNKILYFVFIRQYHLLDKALLPVKPAVWKKKRRGNKVPLTHDKL
jgi:hypothetical protein